MIGQTISHYKILEKLGEGGMGVVYKAEDTKLKRFVALKFLTQSIGDETAKKRFTQEAQAISALDHPNICAIYEIDESADGRMYIAMPCYEGETLQKTIERGPLKLGNVVDIAVQVASGLAKAHEKGVVHRDIKPGNIFLTSDGLAKIVDFGIAKLAMRTKLTTTGTTLGTVMYMSPEQARGDETDHRSDIWSLGVVLYETIAGRVPFRGEHETAVVYSIMNEEPEPLTAIRTGVPMELERIVGKCMAKKPDERYQHADEVIADLRREQRTLESARTGRAATFAAQSAAPTAGAPVAAPKPRRNLLRYFVPAAIVGATVLLILIFNPFNIQVSQRKTAAADRKSVAVLPFTNMSADKEDEFFSDGVTEDIIAQLSNVGELKVISRTSTMQYKNTTKNIREIARELDVATILEGSVRRANNQVRIVAQLIDAASDKHLWSHTYDKELTQVFAIQSDVARQIASALEAELSPREEERLTKQPTGSIDAYSYYIKGREYYTRYGKSDNEHAIELFKKALEFDPDYALAYAGLGDAYAQRTAQFNSPQAWLDSSIAASNKAISLDPTLAEGYKALGLAYQYKGWLRRSLETYRKAVELNPNHDPAVANIGWVNGMLGNFDEAMRWHKRALALSPLVAFTYIGPGSVYLSLGDYAAAEEWGNKALALQPDLQSAQTFLAWVSLARGEYQRFIEQCEELLARDPNSIPGLLMMGGVATTLGDYRRAEEYLARAVAMDSVTYWAVPWSARATGLAYVYWKTGRQDDARKMFARSVEFDRRQLAQGSEDTGVLYDLATVNAIQGNKAEAYDWLQKAIDAGWRSYGFAELDPTLENLRGDDKFKKMMADVKAQVDEMRKRVEEMDKAESSGTKTG